MKSRFVRCSAGVRACVAGACLLSSALVFAAPPPAFLPTPKKLKLASGHLPLGPAMTIAVSDVSLKPLGEVLADDFVKMFGVKKPAVTVGTPPAGGIGLQVVKNNAKFKLPDAYQLDIGTTATVKGGSYQAVAFGMMTLLQAVQTDGQALALPALAIEDDADKAFRALQLSIRGGYHTPEFVKKGIDLMRFYKVRILQLHTSESLWVGSVFESSNGASANDLRGNHAWNKKEMEEVIDYARVRGIAMVPHNEMRPNDPFWPAALTVDFNTNDQFACYVDEVDGKGAYVMPPNGLAKDERFWNFLKVVTQRSYDQFAKGWPGGKLPYYHIGPVYGEGGCNGKEAVKMLTFLKEKNPDIKMMYWNGPGPGDADLSPHKKNLAVDFYSKSWGGTPDGLLAAGYELCNTSWTPLYIQPGTFKKALAQGKWIYDEFAVTRFGKESAFGLPLKENADECGQHADNVMGSLLSTWDFAGERQGDGHLEMVVPCIPYYAEHAWNMKPWPYPKGAYEKAKAAFDVLFPRSFVFIANPVVSRPVGGVTATQGRFKEAVEVSWSEGDNFPSFYQVFRADSNDPAHAQALSPKIPASLALQLNTYRDTTAKPDQKHFYWVQAVNAYGVSELKGSAEGFTGNGAAVPVTYEGFDYQPGAALDTLNGGKGFKDAWSVKQMNAPITINPAGLTYPGLLTTGQSARFEILHDESEGRNPTHTSVLRHLASAYGKPGTEVWTSFLMRPIKNTYTTTISYNRIATGKLYGSYSVAGVPAEDGKTYLVVTRSNFQNGPDLLTTWVNPTPGKMPLDAEATTQSRQEDNGESDILAVNVEAYYKGGSDIDELRMGPTYQSVTPAAH
ncbi:MAG: glycoside hydrolase family 20 zincin-like fold domain-containing protein [bacterium]